MESRSIILISVGITCLLYLVVNILSTIRESYLFFYFTTFLFFIALFSLGRLYLISLIKEKERGIIKKQASFSLKNTDEIIKTNLLSTRQMNEPQKEESSLSSSSSSYLKQVSYYDPITRLPNQVFFNEILNKTLYHARRHRKTVALLMIELNLLKKNSSPFNQDINNLILAQMSNRLTEGLRSEDVLAKLNGNIFISLLSDINKPKFASKVAEKLLHICSQPVEIEGHSYVMACHIGIVIYPIDGTSLEKLMKNIEITLYKAKQNDDYFYYFHTPSLDAEAREYRQLDNALQNAISNKELLLHYQPKLHIKRGSIVGVEALLRWLHPRLGLIYPNEFIPLSEESGLIMEISEWVIRQACQTNKIWQNEGYTHLTMAVNISPHQFIHPGFIASLEKILTETNLHPKYLEIEIPETIIMSNVEKTKKILQDMHALGVRLSMDHFGTGYTSISHLKQFPLSTLKIDPCYIKGIPEIPNDMIITNTLISLAHHLGFEVVAEGVETAEQVQYLATQKCDIIQGYFLSPPLPKEQIEMQFKKLMDEVIV